MSRHIAVFAPTSAARLPLDPVRIGPRPTEHRQTTDPADTPGLNGNVEEDIYFARVP